MNALPLAKKAAILKALTEGLSIRATARVVGASKNTVTKLLVDVGELAAIYHHHVIRNIKARRIQCDEIWSFVGAKQRNVPEAEKGKGRGDCWTWTALDADSKLMVSWMVGGRDSSIAKAFMQDVKKRLANRVQLTTDGHHVYLGAVDDTFGADVDYAMLDKVYAATNLGPNMEASRRYSPASFVRATKIRVMGNPDSRHVSTSYVERQNLTMRMGMRRFTRLTNAFSKKVENHSHAVALHFLHYNFCRPHQTLTAQNRGVHTTPAMAAGLSDHPWKIEELLGLLDPTLLLQ